MKVTFQKSQLNIHSKKVHFSFDFLYKFLIFFFLEIKKQEKTQKRNVVNLENLSLAKTLRCSPTPKVIKTSRLSIDEEAYQEKVNRKLMVHKEKIKESNKNKYFIMNLIENHIFRRIILFIVLLDCIILSFDRYPITPSEIKWIYIADFTIFWILLTEIVIRIIVFGPKLYFLSMFNCCDFLIIFANLNQYIYELIIAPSNFVYELETQSGPLFRIMKLFLIFRLIYYSNSMQKLSYLTKALIKTLYKIKYFLLFVMLIAITCALIGRELFAYRLKILEEGHYKTPRINYDNFYHSMIAVILAYYNEDWNIVMYEIYISFGDSSIIFYMFLIIVGQMTITVLLKALILNYFIKSTPKEFFIHERKFGKKALTFLKSKLQTMKNGMQTQVIEKKSPLLNKSLKKSPILPRKSEFLIPRTFWKTQNFQRSNTANTKNSKKNSDLVLVKNLEIKKNSILEISTQKNASLPIENSKVSSLTQTSPRKKKTLYNIKKRKNYQKFFFGMLNSKYYQYFMFSITLTSMVMQVMDSKFDDPDSEKQICIEIIDRILGSIYFVEFLMNVFTYGFIMNKDSYLRQSFYNKLDFFNIIITICDLFIDKHKLRLFQTLKIVRTFRILKLATKTTNEIQIISNAFAETFPNLFTLITFFLIFLTIFSLIATKYMKGTLFHCENFDEEIHISDKFDCFDNGGDWMDEDIAYNNLLTSMLSLFEISSCQGWTYLMVKSIDGMAVDKEPMEDANPLKALFFIVYFFIANFLLLNMFVGIIIENIIVNKNKASKKVVFFIIFISVYRGT